MRGRVLARHRGPVNVSVVWVRTLCHSPCGMRPRRAVRCVAMVWCCVALCRCEECRRPLAGCVLSELVGCSVGCCRCALIWPRHLRALAPMQSLI